MNTIISLPLSYLFASIPEIIAQGKAIICVRSRASTRLMFTIISSMPAPEKIVVPYVVARSIIV